MNVCCVGASWYELPGAPEVVCVCGTPSRVITPCPLRPVRSTDVAIFVVTVTTVGPANTLNCSNTDFDEVAIFVVVAGLVLVERSVVSRSDDTGASMHDTPEHPLAQT